MYEEGSELSRQIDEAAEHSDDGAIQMRPTKAKKERTQAQKNEIGRAHV